MTDRALKLLSFLKSMSNEKGETQFSLLTLSANRRFGCKTIVNRSLQELKQEGYIERKKVYCGSSITKLTQKAIDWKDEL